MAALGLDDGVFEVDKSVSLYELISSDVLPLDKFLLQKSWTGAQKERTMMLGKALPSVLKPLKRVAETWFEVSLGNEETRKSFR